MENVVDLDVLRPPKQIVRFNGKEIDVSFIPCGITFEVDELIKNLEKLDPVKVKTNSAETRKAFNLTLRICSTFCMTKDPEMTEQWFRENASPEQVEPLASMIVATLQRSLENIEEQEKN